eukprot:3010198-Karenia_brevis.AAC.1
MSAQKNNQPFSFQDRHVPEYYPSQYYQCPKILSLTLAQRRLPVAHDKEALCLNVLQSYTFP